MSADNGRAARRGQLPPVGPHPDIEVVFVGALMWSANGHAAVLELVCDDDIGNPTTAAVLTAVRSLVTSGKPVGPQLVYDELRRHGPVRRAVADALRAVTTSGADPAAAWYYGTAVVAAALRRRVESAGVALSAAAREAPEDELVLHVQRAAAGIADCGRRLTELRG